MRIGVVTAVHERPYVTKLFYTAVARYREHWAPHDVRCYVAGDDPRHEALAAQHGAIWCPVPNDPLGAKLNASAMAALADGVDYALMLGSDDLLSPDLAERYRIRLEQGVRYAGLAGLRFIYPPFAQAVKMVMYRSLHRRYEPVGPGRVLSHALLAELHGCPFFPLLRKGLDWSLHQQIEVRTALGTQGDIWVPGDTDFLMDVKTAVNMWRYQDIQKYGTAISISYRQTVRCFPQAEQDMLYLIGQGLT